jgi:tetratricopeptide (TPR) repeat protein
LLRTDPNFHDARLAIGVYQYVAGSLKWNVKWLAVLMGYRGSRERGKQELATAAEKGSLVGDDARVVLTLIHTRERSYQKAFDYLNELLRKYPRNYLVHLDMGGMALLMKRPEAAIEIYQDILRRHERLERASVYNRLGVALRERKDLKTAVEWFSKALQETAASARSKTIARLELGKTLDLLGRRAEARERYREVAEAEDVAGSRGEAQDLLRRPYVGRASGRGGL